MEDAEFAETESVESKEAEGGSGQTQKNIRNGITCHPSGTHKMFFMIAVRIAAPYYTAVYIPTEKKEAEDAMRHLAEIVEADKY